MYTLMFFKSPFNPGEKLAQINGNYRIPEGHRYSTHIIDLLKQMLTQNPLKRIGIGEVWSAVDVIKDMIINGSELPLMYQSNRPQVL